MLEIVIDLWYSIYRNKRKAPNRRAKDVIIQLESRSYGYLVSIYSNGSFMDCEVIYKTDLLQIIAWASCKIQELGLND